jgi:hypothetical protein
MKKLLLLLSLAAGLRATAQVSPAPADTSAPLPPPVIVEKDPRMDEMAGKKIAIAGTGTRNTDKVKVDKFGRVNMPGFRIQVLNTTDRTQVYQTKAMLYQKYPGHGQYVIAQAPFFKLTFGNFTSKPEAEKFRKMLAPLFPSGIYIVSAIIETKMQKPQKTEEKEKPKKKEKDDQ